MCRGVMLQRAVPSLSCSSQSLLLHLPPPPSRLLLTPAIGVFSPPVTGLSPLAQKPLFASHEIWVVQLPGGTAHTAISVPPSNSGVTRPGTAPRLRKDLSTNVYTGRSLHPPLWLKRSANLTLRTLLHMTLMVIYCYYPGFLFFSVCCLVYAHVPLGISLCFGSQSVGCM